MLVWINLSLQVAFALIGLRVLHQRMCPHLETTTHRDLVLDVWLPLLIALPIIILAGGQNREVSIDGWIIVGGPVICALLGVGAGLVTMRSRQFDGGAWALGAWTAAGLVLLLLGAAHYLSIWVGQCLFALAALVMWINTPETPAASPTPADESLAGGCLWMFFLAAGQGAAALMLPPELRATGATIMIAYAAICLASLAVAAGGHVAVRVSGWTGTYGVTFGLGVMSVVAMWPYLRAAFSPEPPTMQPVARGFGVFAMEATGLLILPAVVLGAQRLRGRTRVAAGIVVLLISATVAASRLTGGPAPDDAGSVPVEADAAP